MATRDCTVQRLAPTQSCGTSAQVTNQALT